MTTRPLPPAIRGLVGVALAAWVALVAVFLLSPTPEGPSWLVGAVAREAHRLGAPPSLTALERVEFLLNVVAFMPVSFLGSLMWSRLTWRDWTAGGFVASFLVELVQAVALDARSATHTDVVANTAGALAGAVLAWLLLAPFRTGDSS